MEFVSETLPSIEDESETTSLYVPDEVIENLRQDYLNSFAEKNVYDFILRQFKTLKSFETHPWDVCSKPFSIIDHNGIMHEVCGINGFCTFGRHSLCDVEISCIDRSDVSRMQFIGLLVKHNVSGKTMFVIMDFWSFGGTRVHGTSWASLPNDRQLLIIPTEYPFTLELSAMSPSPVTIQMFVRMCIICGDNPRSHTLACGHCISCENCTNMLHTKHPNCPICRVPIEKDAVRMAKPHEAMTYCDDNEDEYNAQLEQSINESKKQLVSNACVDVKKCDNCSKILPKSAYSGRQWRRAQQRRCKECIDTCN